MRPERTDELFALAGVWRAQGATEDADELVGIAEHRLQDFREREALEAEKRRVAALPRHRIAVRGGHREVATEHRAGRYAVHHEGDGTWAVTHLPSGWRVGACWERLPAVGHADHMHAHARDVGADCAFGEMPPDDVSAALRAAGMNNPALVRS